MPIVEGAGVALAYEERGAGAPVVLVHGMATDRSAWEPVGAALADRARVVAYDRRGYGDSGAPQPYERTTVAEQAEDLVALLDGLALRGALAGAAGFGALVVLDVLLRHPGALAGAVLVDPPLHALVPEATEPLAAERLALEEALREGGPAAAVRAWRAAHGVEAATGGDDDGAPARGFFPDYGGQTTLSVRRRDLRALAGPLVVLATPGAPAHVRAAGDALAELVPGARREREADPAAALAALLGLAGRSAQTASRP